MVRAGRDRVQRQVELVLPPELEAGLGERVVPLLRAGVLLGQVSRVGRDAVGDQPSLHVLAVGQAQVLLGRHVAEHGAAHGPDVGRADARGDVVVPGCDVGGQRPQRVEGRLVAPLQLVLHVDGDLVQGHVAGALVHHLHVLLPGAQGELALHLELGELRLVVGVVDGPRPEAVADAQRDVVLVADVQDLVPVLVGEVLPVVAQAVLGVDGAPAAHDARHAVHRHGHESQQHARVDGPVVHALLGLLDQRLAEHLPGQVLRDAVHLLQRLVDGHGAHGDGRVAHDPLARLVDVLARGQVHDGVRAPERGPLQLLHLLLDAGDHRRVADVRVHLDFEHAADDLRLQLQVALVGADDRAPAGHLGPHELGVHPLARRHIRHLLSDNALLGVVHLGVPLVSALLATLDPFLPQLGDALAGAEPLGAAGVIHIQVPAARIFIGEVDATKWDAEQSTSFLVHNLLVLFSGGRVGLTERSGFSELWIEWILGGHTGELWVLNDAHAKGGCC
mmetsp:Transcript_11094/g.18065  ORF Transcript_11094/g.18065 Transcript_11094/m.18065 type:complete len:505 (-) Transcript_11094:186-1700(-)